MQFTKNKGVPCLYFKLVNIGSAKLIDIVIICLLGLLCEESVMCKTRKVERIIARTEGPTAHGTSHLVNEGINQFEVVFRRFET